MSNIVIVVQPSILPVSQLLREKCNSPDFLTNNIWKIAFSPCSQYLAIPKQDIDGQHCVLVVHCSDWHAKNVTESTMRIHNQFNCTAAIWSLAFGQRTSKSNLRIDRRPFDASTLSTPTVRRGSLDRRSSLPVVNRRYDFSKNLFLAAGLASGKIEIWNIDTGELILVLKDHQLTVCGLDFTSCTMQLASCSHDTTIKLWDLFDDGKRRKKQWIN
ncbi:unnamed protein product [Rotaria magnacalcarata]|uniref:Uncharacterized protein n=1 Tax=Rotaria magnacalcarata TaxID=392030 RepID=A0A8S3AUT9_9BILA|nr:unnamed protein product [Rotaria magnacalcarata]